MQIDVADVVKSYATVQAVRGLSFNVRPGEIFAILGPNGAGKSSTLRMLIGLTSPDSGQIRFTHNGVSSARLSQQDFGYLPEDRGLYQDRKILDSLTYIGRLKGLSVPEVKQRAAHWLTLFDLEQRQKDQLKTLSKGNQQKVQLISAVLHQPAIVFLDEPFSGLDPVNQEKVIGFLTELRQQGTTIVLSAHQMSLVEKLADRFLLMADGQAALYGDLASIREQSALSTRLIVEFARDIDCDLMQIEGVVACHISPANKAQLELAQDAQVASVLQALMARLPLVSLETQAPTLHDIYLNTVSNRETTND